jgi:hypothetical protein
MPVIARSEATKQSIAVQDYAVDPWIASPCGLAMTVGINGQR